MITPKTISNGIIRALLIVLIVGLILFFFTKFNRCLSISLYPDTHLNWKSLLDFLKAIEIQSYFFATILTIVLFILIISGFIMMFVPLILSQGQNLSLLNTSNRE
jgi:hypothetical protein